MIITTLITWAVLGSIIHGIATAEGETATDCIKYALLAPFTLISLATNLLYTRWTERKK